MASAVCPGLSLAKRLLMPMHMVLDSPSCMRHNRKVNMERFSLLDISGDIGISTAGATLSDVFVNAGMALYCLTTDIKAVREQLSREVHVEAATCDVLLVRFLNELIFLLDSEQFIGHRIEIDALQCDLHCSEPVFLSARIQGEEFSPVRHEQRLLLKAATYHKLRLEQQKDGWYAEVIFDI